VVDKYEYAKSIITTLQGITHLNFQSAVGMVLTKYYTYKNRHFEIPSHFGGDDKNDGWVVEDAIFYQIYSPVYIRSSFVKDLHIKYKTDLEGLLEGIKEGKWKGEIKKFVFIVNTHDTQLPKDPDRFFEKTTLELQSSFGLNFEFEVSNLDYVRKLLHEIDSIDIFRDISVNLNMNRQLLGLTVTESSIREFIELLGAKIMDEHIHQPSKENYSRISTPKKILINDLESRRELIEQIITKLEPVDLAIKSINQDISSINKFETVRKYIIDQYVVLAASGLDGCQLWDSICDSIQSKFSNPKNVEPQTIYLVTYIFDHCDIFKKEEEDYVVAK